MPADILAFDTLSILTQEKQVARTEPSPDAVECPLTLSPFPLFPPLTREKRGSGVWVKGLVETMKQVPWRDAYMPTKDVGT